MSKYIQIADNLFHYIQTNQKRIEVFYLQNAMSCDIIRQENSPEYLAIQGSYSKTVLAFDLSDGDAYTTIPRCSIYRSIHECCVVAMLFVLNVAEDILASNVEIERTDALCHTAVEEHESVCLLDF